MRIKSIRQAKNLSGKIVFLRADFNVPIKNKAIQDDYKIAASLPTIRFLLRHNCRLIIATHLSLRGRSAKPISKRLAELLGRKVVFAPYQGMDKIKARAEKMKAKDILLLENLRFYSGEEKNENKFARSLAALADIYVNDGFAVCHRRHASVSAIKKYLPGYAGLLLEKEVLNLEKILKPKQPLISIIGGAKIETKIALIESLARRSYRLLIGGALANNFIAAHGFKIGRSLAGKASVKTAADLIKRHKNVILPVDAIVARKADPAKLFRAGSVASVSGSQVQARPVNQVMADDAILDIGPKTIKLFAHFIKQANTIVWNGPLGYFENPHFKHGTLAIARLVASRSGGRAFGAAGGGETMAALKMTKMEHYLDWVSSGGGAMLAFLAGRPMPGLKGIAR